MARTFPFPILSAKRPQTIVKVRTAKKISHISLVSTNQLTKKSSHLTSNGIPKDLPAPHRRQPGLDRGQLAKRLVDSCSVGRDVRGIDTRVVSVAYVGFQETDLGREEQKIGRLR